QPAPGAGGLSGRDALQAAVPSGPSVPAGFFRSGYLQGQPAIDSFGPTATGQYWARSGVTGYGAFFLPIHYADPFGNPTTLTYDPFDLFVQASTDARDNSTSIARFDYRVLAPAALDDINGNRTKAWFDVLGRVTALAVGGKPDGAVEGDTFTGYDDDFA